MDPVAINLFVVGKNNWSTSSWMITPNEKVFLLEDHKDVAWYLLRQYEDWKAIIFELEVEAFCIGLSINGHLQNASKNKQKEIFSKVQIECFRYLKITFVSFRNLIGEEMLKIASKIPKSTDILLNDQAEQWAHVQYRFIKTRTIRRACTAD